jgi:ribosomal protein L37AE/L43A
MSSLQEALQDAGLVPVTVDKVLDVEKDWKCPKCDSGVLECISGSSWICTICGHEEEVLV